MIRCSVVGREDSHADFGSKFLFTDQETDESPRRDLQAMRFGPAVEKYTELKNEAA